MIKKLIIFVSFVATISFFLVSGPTVESMMSESRKGQMIYYENFSGYKIPLVLVGEILRDEAVKRDAYYVGHYDEFGKLYMVEKFFRGKLSFRHHYQYYSSGKIRESRTVNDEGTERINYFDENGKPID